MSSAHLEELYNRIGSAVRKAIKEDHMLRFGKTRELTSTYHPFLIDWA
jgi:hypothetical protein